MLAGCYLIVFSVHRHTLIFLSRNNSTGATLYTQVLIRHAVRSDVYTHFVMQNVLSGWVGENIFITTFCATKWFQRKSQDSKRKNINNKNYKQI